MYGSIIGDMVGEPYEFAGIKKIEFDFQMNRFTDDTVMTVAVADALMKSGKEYNIEQIKTNFINSMQYFGRKFDHAGYGTEFYTWLNKRCPKPYNSYGNGSAMRVGSIAYFFPKNLERALEIAKSSAEISHNHPDGVKGAVSVTELIWLANAGADKYKIKDALEKYYKLDKSSEEIRKAYKFDIRCEGTVPVAVQCFLEGRNYEEVVRLAISMGGDSDTLACIAGSIAEAYYGVPEHLKRKCRQCLIQQEGKELLDVVDSFYDYVRKLECGNECIPIETKHSMRRKAHTMEIREASDFFAIENGEKDYHIRLYDEKRQRIFPNDFITFQLDGTDKRCIKRVKGIYLSNIDELLKVTILHQEEREHLLKFYTSEELKNGPVMLLIFC